MWRLATSWRVAVDRALAPHGITHAQYSVLATLHGLPIEPSQRRLADHTGLEPLYISKIARSLSAAGLITRDPDPADSRAFRLTLTARGRSVAAEAVGVVAALHERLLAPLGGPDSPRAAAFTQELQLLLEGDLS